MAWWGKVVGGAFGLLVGGPLGALVGSVVGHQFDRGMNNLDGWGASGSQERVQGAFFTATFSVMGFLAKADGRVSEHEIAAATAIMNQLQLNAEQKKVAQKLFREGKDKTSDEIESLMDQFRQECHRRTTLMQMFLEIQMAVACSDGEMHSAEEALLRKIANWLGFSSQQFEWMLQRAMASIRFAHQQHQYQGQAGGHYAGPSSATQLTDAYRILGVEKSATDAEVKRAYRKLMSQHHPDKLVSKGLPEEMIKLAKEKTQEIKGAYELIMKTRK